MNIIASFTTSIYVQIANILTIWIFYSKFTFGRKNISMFKLNLGKTKIPHNKNTAELAPVRMSPPQTVCLPMAQHIGAPSVPIVKVGDTVKVGQKIAEGASPVSSPIFASVSGTVVKFDTNKKSDGRVSDTIIIESDGLMTPADDIAPPSVSDLDSFVTAIKNSGIVGLGGAGFPTAIKFAIQPGKVIDTVVLNGAECEPYITVDTRTMLDESDPIRDGIELIRRFLPSVSKFVIGIEKNKPGCIKKMKEVFASDKSVTVKALPLLYPQGAEKVLIHTTTGRIVPEGKLPADVGVLVINVTTLATIAKYIKTGMPLVERCVTVDGSAIKNPMNVIAPIGTSVRDLIDFTGGLDEVPVKIIFGGPMTGAAAYSLDEPIIKTTNALLAFAKEDAVLTPASACIHCGKCVEACPHKLEPTSFCKALDIDNQDERLARLEELRINLCVECGCCSFVCPASRPLVESNRSAKKFVREYKAHKANLK